ncbi:MAG TPA: hypothetical protein VFU19_13495 [Iamia sp.]|nr:hypothetical protein [Iamia sp.]
MAEDRPPHPLDAELTAIRSGAAEAAYEELKDDPDSPWGKAMWGQPRQKPFPTTEAEWFALHPDHPEAPMTTDPTTRPGAKIRDAAVDPRPELPAGRGYNGTLAGITFRDGTPLDGEMTDAVRQYADRNDALAVVGGRLAITTGLPADNGVPANAGREGPEGNPHGSHVAWAGLGRATPYQLHPEAPHEKWVDLAVAHGLDRETAEAMTRGELVDAYGATEVPDDEETEEP